jgi:hypothetical protein
LGTVVSWHLSSQNASASLPPPPKPKKATKRIVTLRWKIGGGVRIWLNDKPQSGTDSDYKEMDSGDTISQWSVVGPPFPAGALRDPASGKWYIDSPGFGLPEIKIEYRRQINKAAP